MMTMTMTTTTMANEDATTKDATTNRDEEVAVSPQSRADATPPSEPIYQTPDWEIPTHPPPQKRSFRNSLTLLGTAAAAALENVAPAKETKETANTTAANGATTPPPETRSNGGLSLGTTIRDRFNTALPAHRKYFGQPRRRFLLFIVLPIFIVLFIVLPLVVGLGVGLSRRNSSKTQNLPLPDGNGNNVFTGELTYYDPALGACGIVSDGDEAICAVSHLLFDAAGSNSASGGNSNNNPLCGRRIKITREFSGTNKRAGGKRSGITDRAGGVSGNRSVDVTVVDRCVGCEPADLDLSLSAFEQLALKENGRVVGSWAWLD